MGQSAVKLQTKLMREYYKDFSKYAKGRKPEKKVAWVTAFTPVEILEALGMEYYYPESYAAVIAASQKEQELITRSQDQYLSRDCCSYSCCFNGCIDMEDGPRGVPPSPDLLIATNNQCNTLPNWWNVLANKYDIPLFVLDYPGENADRKTAFSYVTEQHKALISWMEAITGNKLSEDLLNKMIEQSNNSVKAWGRITCLLSKKEIEPTLLFDSINFLITARCKPETAEMYEILEEEIQSEEDADSGKIPLFWLGYPLWYHPKRYLKELLDGFRVSGSNYINWWNLDYSGEDVYEKLFSAYNYTFLNLCQNTRDIRLHEQIRSSGAKGAIVLHNKSCKCDFVSARNVGIPQAELEIDMIDRTYLDKENAKRMIDLLRYTLCTE